MEIAPPPAPLQRREREAGAPKAPEEETPSALATEEGEVEVEEGSEPAPGEVEE